MWRAVAAIATVFLAGTTSSPGRADESKSAHDQIVRVGPHAHVLGPEGPVRLSLEKKNTIRWVANEPVTVVFPSDNFPVLEDGTRVELPPLEGMRSNKEKTKWYPYAASDAGTINPALASLLARARDGELLYRYRIQLDSAWGYGSLIIQK